MVNEEHKQMVKDCEKRSSRLDDWSQDFIKSLREQIDSGKPLTEKQATKLDEIWEKATAEG